MRGGDEGAKELGAWDEQRSGLSDVLRQVCDVVFGWLDMLQLVFQILCIEHAEASGGIVEEGQQKLNGNLVDESGSNIHDRLNEGWPVQRQANKDRVPIAKQEVDLLKAY